MSLIQEVAEYVIKQGRVNHRLIIIEVPGVDNYNRSAELVDDLQKAGIVSPFNGDEPRTVLIKDIEKAKLLLTEVVEPQIIKSDGK